MLVRRLKFFYVVIFLTIITNSIAAATIKPFTAKYDVYRNGLLIARSARTFSNNKNTYEFKSSTTLAGIASVFLDINVQEKSTLLFKQDEFYLQNYQYNKNEKNKNEKFTIRYSAKKNNLYHSLTKQSHTEKKQQYDILSFSIGIMSDLMKSELHKHYTILEKNKVRDYLFQTLDKTPFTYQGKVLQAFTLEQVKMPSRDQFTFWCAEKLQYLPIRIKKTETDGDVILMKLTHYNGRDIELSTQLDDEPDE